MILTSLSKSTDFLLEEFLQIILPEEIENQEALEES